jgi:hypothetical protein
MMLSLENYTSLMQGVSDRPFPEILVLEDDKHVDLNRKPPRSHLGGFDLGVRRI